MKSARYCAADRELRADRNRYEIGAIISVGDGIARIHGLEKVMSGEMLSFRTTFTASRLKPGRGASGRGVVASRRN